MDPVYIFSAIAAALILCLGAITVAVILYFHVSKRAARSNTKTVRRRAKPVSTPLEDGETGRERLAPESRQKSDTERRGRRTRRLGSVRSDECHFFRYSGKTVLFYDPEHGNQIEYYDPGGRCYLWYPGNSVVVAGDWRIDGEYLYFRYGTNTYNPVTNLRGGGWEPALLSQWETTIVDAVPGDVFGLAMGDIPYPLFSQPALRSVYDAKHWI